MKKALAFLAFLFLLPMNVFASPQDGIKKIPSNDTSDYVEGQVIVKYKDSRINLKNTTDRKSADSLEKNFAFNKVDEVKDFNLRLLKSKLSTKDAIAKLKKDPNVEYAEPNFKKHYSAVANDSLFNNLWALRNTGQTVNGTPGTAGADIEATTAWDTENPSATDVIVADIDSGSDITHQDLSANLWDGSSCLDENGSSISGGCPNHGWNYEDNNNDPQDFNGHGTFISGIIAARNNNALGVSGMSYYNHLKVMPIKFGLDTISEIKAINFAKNNGAKVINASFGGPSFSQAEHDAIASFPGVFVAAAGNDNSNNDSAPSYPASYDNANIITVASTDQNDGLSSFSNFGASSVDIGAPGENIVSAALTTANIFTENFDSSITPNLPATFSDPSGKWTSEQWSVGSSDIYTYPGIYSATPSSSELTMTSPINTSAVGYLNLQFYLTADIESFSDDNCVYDWLEIKTDNNDGNWVTRKKICGYYLGSTVNVNLAGAESSSMRIKFVWVTDGSNEPGLFVGTPITPHVDDVSLDGIAQNGNSYAYGDGTSFAAPYVAGASAMVIGKYPGHTTAQIKNHILATGDSIPSLSGKVSSGKRLNLNNALLTEPSFSPPSTPVYRFWSSVRQGHFYTISETEKAKFVADKTWRYEGAAYKAFGATGTNILPVYQFYNATARHYFYTIFENEKNSLVATSKSWKYQKIAYYAYQTSPTDSTPLYRFYSSTKRGHFFTTSLAERDSLIANNKSWRYEGIAWYVPTN